ncbi:hypothetical protein AGMMS50256_16830 [Betaproteobacteria bacterium]|nr:hypothetical protein AGMMS50256_16830 [Betaproteobacteria bacterium]
MARMRGLKDFFPAGKKTGEQQQQAGTDSPGTILATHTHTLSLSLSLSP